MHTTQRGKNNDSLVVSESIVVGFKKSDTIEDYSQSLRQKKYTSKNITFATLKHRNERFPHDGHLRKILKQIDHEIE